MDNETHGERMKAAILAEGLAMMREAPGSVSARGIGQRLGKTHSAVLYHFDNAEALRDAVAAYAVSQGCAETIRYLIAIRHAAVADMPEADRLRYLAA